MRAHGETAGVAAASEHCRAALGPRRACQAGVHPGKGATVGSVIAIRQAVSPADVGVDIGCGLNAVLTSLTAVDAPDNLHALQLRQLVCVKG